ncbi:MAG: hypothetical protein ACRDVN_14655 [Jiangellaceae bacterium]
MARQISDLPPDVCDVLRTGDGVIDVRRARAVGLGEGRIRRLVAAGDLTRVAAGRYAATAVLESLDEWQKHRLRGRAFVASCGADAYLTGWSAVVTWGLPTLGRPPDLPVVVRPKAPQRSPQTTPYGHVLVSELPDRHRIRSNRLAVVSRSWAVTDVARSAPLAHALVVADAAARAGVDLDSALRDMSRWPDVVRARWVVDHADPCAENPLETLGRFTCLEFALPMPVSNAWVGADAPVYRVDGLWPFHWAASEGDGAVKYDNRPDASAIVAAQNEREWYLRRLGLDFARYGWQLAMFRRAELAQRFTALLRDNPPRREPIRWWKHVPGVGPVDPTSADWPSPLPVDAVLPA